MSPNRNSEPIGQAPAERIPPGGISLRALLGIGVLLIASVAGGKYWLSNRTKPQTPLPSANGKLAPVSTAVPAQAVLPPSAHRSLRCADSAGAAGRKTRRDQGSRGLCDDRSQGSARRRIRQNRSNRRWLGQRNVLRRHQSGIESAGEVARASGTDGRRTLSTLVCGKEFASASLVPAKLEPGLFGGPNDDSPRRRLWRAAGTRKRLTQRGFDGCGAAMRELLAPLAKLGEPAAAFKIFNVTVDGTTGECTAYFQATGATRNRSRKSTPRRSRPARPVADGPWLIQSIRLADYERAEQNVAGGRLFNDCTASALAKTPGYEEQILRGTDYWGGRFDSSIEVDSAGHRGLAIGDVNGDGLDDILVTIWRACRTTFTCNSRTARSRHRGRSRLGLPRPRAALFVDFDNDGDQDLAMARVSRSCSRRTTGRAHSRLSGTAGASQSP